MIALGDGFNWWLVRAAYVIYKPFFGYCFSEGEWELCAYMLTDIQKYTSHCKTESCVEAGVPSHTEISKVKIFTTRLNYPISGYLLFLFDE